MGFGYYGILGHPMGMGYEILGYYGMRLDYNRMGWVIVEWGQVN